MVAWQATVPVKKWSKSLGIKWIEWWMNWILIHRHILCRVSLLLLLSVSSYDWLCWSTVACTSRRHHTSVTSSLGCHSGRPRVLDGDVYHASNEASVHWRARFPRGHRTCLEQPASGPVPTTVPTVLHRLRHCTCFTCCWKLNMSRISSRQTTNCFPLLNSSHSQMFCNTVCDLEAVRLHLVLTFNDNFIRIYGNFRSQPWCIDVWIVLGFSKKILG